MVARNLPKVEARVRFPSPAQLNLLPSVPIDWARLLVERTVGEIDALTLNRANMSD